MIRLLVIGFLFFLAGSVNAQFLQEHHIFNSSGVQSMVGQFQVVSSLGEPVAGSNALAGSGFLYKADTTWMTTNPLPGQSHATIRAFPNPSSSWVTLMSEKEISQVEIFNGSGQKLGSQQVIGKSTTVDVRNMASGNYFLRIKFSKAGYSLIHLLVAHE